MDIDIISDPVEFEALAPEWSLLWETTPGSTPFQSPEWQIPWWRHFGQDRLKAIVLKKNGRLAGVLPVFIMTQSAGGAGKEPALRTAFMNGTGISDYLDVLVRPDLTENATALFLEALGWIEGDWDRCDFQEIRQDSPLLRQRAPEGTAIEISPMQVCPSVALPGSKEAYLEGLNPKYRRNLRRSWRLLEKKGGAEIEAAGEDTIPEFLDALFDLHSRQWRERNQPGVLREESIRTFHREVAAAMFRKGCLRLYRLRHVGKVISALYLFAAGETTFCYLGGFDPDEEQLSPGAVIIEHAIGEAISEGRREFDFLRGNEAYKYLWGCRDRQNYRMVIRKVSSFEFRVSS